MIMPKGIDYAIFSFYLLQGGNKGSDAVSADALFSGALGCELSRVATKGTYPHHYIKIAISSERVVCLLASSSSEAVNFKTTAA
ncbi:MAG TPA: hypothetical protein VK099_08895 [Alcanivoracaceae bacterium]|nr:hypothetical protein [Alcanivoracaceae bacterium]